MPRDYEAEMRAKSLRLACEFADRLRVAPGLDRIATLEEAEKQHILLALLHFQGNRTATAEALGISIKGLYTKLKRYARQEARLQASITPQPTLERP